MTTPYERDTDPLRTTAQTTTGSTSPIGDELLGQQNPSYPAPVFASETDTTSSRPDVKDRASDVASSAADHGGDVVDTAKDEAQQVVGEAKDKAADLLAEARTHVEDQSRTQLQGLSAKLQELGDELDSMVDGSDQQGTVTDLARQLSTRVNALSSHLADRNPQDVLEDARSFARQRPGTFIAGALVAGVVAGRLTRGAKKAQATAADDTASISGSSTNGMPATTGFSVAQNSVTPNRVDQNVAAQNSAPQNIGGMA